jgi:hypothetical protein
MDEVFYLKQQAFSLHIQGRITRAATTGKFIMRIPDI